MHLLDPYPSRDNKKSILINQPNPLITLQLFNLLTLNRIWFQIIHLKQIPQLYKHRIMNRNPWIIKSINLGFLIQMGIIVKQVKEMKGKAFNSFHKFLLNYKTKMQINWFNYIIFLIWRQIRKETWEIQESRRGCMVNNKSYKRITKTLRYRSSRLDLQHIDDYLHYN